MSETRLANIDENGNFTSPQVLERLTALFGGGGTGASDSLVAGYITDTTTDTSAAVEAAAEAATGVSSADPLHTSKLVPLPGRSGLFVRNEQSTYALKLDQYDTNGTHDTANIVADFPGAHTALGIKGGNTDFSTVKVTNTAAQVGGAIYAAVGENSGRTATLYSADNHGQGPSYTSSMKTGSDGVAFRAAYDPGAYTKSAVWVTAHHTSSHLVHIENDGAHTAGSLLRLAQTSASSTVPVISIANSGTGYSISAPAFNVMKDGRVQLGQIEGHSSWSHGSVRMQAGGVLVERSANDANPVLRVQNTSSTGSGDIAQFIKTGGDVTSRVNRNGALVSKSSITPADTDLANNEMVFWYDATASAFKVKAKDANGVVKVGTMTLA